MNNSKRKYYSSDNKISTLIIKAEKYYDQERLEQANYLYQEALELEPENTDALNGLGLIAMQTGMLSIAVELFDAACAIDPDNIIVNKNLALVYTAMFAYDNAMLHYLHILSIDEGNADAHTALAKLHLKTGNIELSLKHYSYAFELSPESPENFIGMVQLDANSISSENINTIEGILQKPDLPIEARCGFYFALGNIFDVTGRYDEAFANYLVANISKGTEFSTKKHEKYIAKLIHTFSREVFEEYSSCELNCSNQPVFIVGMPGSGTNMIKLILENHSDICTTEALNLAAGVAQCFNIGRNQSDMQAMFLEDNKAESLKNFAQFYINDINNMAKKQGYKKPLRIIDDFPENFIHLGLIALLFPNAKIIHCRRNPLDVCLSCYFEDFSESHEYAYDLKNIARYYQQYERLMNHWNKVLPVDIHTVDYEQLMAEPESLSAELIKYLDLDWQNGCATLYKAAGHGDTTSASQDRNKLRQSSVNHWCHYDRHLRYPIKALTAINYT